VGWDSWPTFLRGKRKMTVKEFLINSEKKNAEIRLSKLSKIGAPEIIIENLKKKIENPESDFKVGGSKELLEVEYSNHEVLTGKGGKIHLLINGYIVYFPSAKYGRFITEDNGANS
jgi:hypothetical protein